MSVASILAAVSTAVAGPGLVTVLTPTTTECGMIVLLKDRDAVAVGVVMYVPGSAARSTPQYRWTCATPKGGPVDDGRDVDEFAARDLAEVLLHCVRVHR